MIANLITLSRMPLLALIILLLYQRAPTPSIVAGILVIVLILMDTVDGIVARHRGESSVLGSVLDIAADRTVEFLLWVVYADLGLISIVIPLVVLARGVFVDSIRAVAPSMGLTPFEMMRSPLARFLVKSPWLRSPFGIAKAIAFCLLALARGLLLATHSAASLVWTLSQVAAWIAFALCLLRGLPVLVDGARVLSDPNLARKAGE